MRITPTILLASAVLLGCDDTPSPLGLDAAASSTAGPATAAANGGAHWTVPASLFGFEIGNKLQFNARKRADGQVSGTIDYHQEFLGNSIHLVADVTCMAVYDGGTRVKYGGPVRVSNDPDIVPGEVFIWFQGIDNGQGASSPPDQSTIAGAGDDAANEAFCASSAEPRFAFDVTGNIDVSG